MLDNLLSLSATHSYIITMCQGSFQDKLVMAKDDISLHNIATKRNQYVEFALTNVLLKLFRFAFNDVEQLKYGCNREI